ncbi:MAG: LysM peptidoglycan-binding domain-containing protein [Phycisphaerae bacterium]|nr:LysM peptidoglycan-binding domain-containing protein [Phycisphaerae bacterium]
MQRSAVRLAVVALSCLVIAGCGGKKKNGNGMAADYTASDDYYQPYESKVASTPAYEQTNYGTTADPYAETETTGKASADTYATTTASGTRYHQVAKGDTLFGLARLYYNDQRRWKDIYEANRAALPDPNRIRVGQKLVIP